MHDVMFKPRAIWRLHIHERQPDPRIVIDRSLAVHFPSQTIRLPLIHDLDDIYNPA
jgi:hypothetical protein